MPSEIHWPSALPSGYLLPPPTREGHGYTPRSAALQTDFGIVSRSRQIYSDASADLQVSFVFTASQLAYFEAWHCYRLCRGTQWFWLPVIVAGVTEEREVSFNGTTFSALVAGVNHGRLTATLVTRKGTQMDRETFEVIEEVGSVDGYAALLQALELFVNQDGLAPLE